MPEEIKAMIHRVVEEVWHQGNPDGLEEMYDANIVRHHPPIPDVVGLNAYKQFVAGMMGAYSDLQLTIDEIIVEGNASAMRFTMHAKHTGQSPTMPILPTGKQIAVPACVVAHWVDGKIVEEWYNVDYLGTLQQLGAIPAMGAASQ